jgi:uncharacterized protein
MEHTIRVKIMGAVAVLAIGAAGGLVASTWLVSSAYRARWDQVGKSDRSMTVTGSARRRIRSDVVQWSIWIQGDAKELKEAYAQVKDGADRVRKYLDARGVKPADVQVSAIETEAHHARDKDGHDTPDVIGYTLTRWFNVRSSDVEAIEQIAGDVTELIEQGVHLGSRRPEFTYSKLADLKVDIIGEAARDARTRADTIAGNAGCRIAEVRTARMGVLQVTSPDSTATSGEGVFDTTTIEKDVTSVVALTIVVKAQ